jgi:hypothetical protein
MKLDAPLGYKYWCSLHDYAGPEVLREARQTLIESGAGTCCARIGSKWPRPAKRKRSLSPAAKLRFRRTRIRVNLQHIPAKLRPPQEPLDPDEKMDSSS